MPFFWGAMFVTCVDAVMGKTEVPQGLLDQSVYLCLIPLSALRVTHTVMLIKIPSKSESMELQTVIKGTRLALIMVSVGACESLNLIKINFNRLGESLVEIVRGSS